MYVTVYTEDFLPVITRDYCILEIERDLGVRRSLSLDIVGILAGVEYGRDSSARALG